MGLAVPDALAPTERHDRQRGRTPQKLTGRARQMILRLRRWLPRRPSCWWETAATLSWTCSTSVNRCRNRLPSSPGAPRTDAISWNLTAVRYRLPLLADPGAGICNSLLCNPQDDCKVSELDRRGGRWSALGGRRKSWLAGAWISGLETILPGAGRSDRC